MNFIKKILNPLTKKEIEKIPLYIDFDGTLVNSPKRLTQMLNKKYNMNKIWWKIYRYDCSDVFPEITLHQRCEPFADKSFFNCQLKKKRFAEFVLCKLKNYFDIYIVTLGTEKNLINKEEWCKLNFKFPHTFIGLTNFEEKKSSVDMSSGIFIEDHIKMLESSNARYKILIKGFCKREWNDFNDYDYFNTKYLATSKSWIGIHKLLQCVINVKEDGDF